MILIPDTNFLIYLAKYKMNDEIEKLGMQLMLPSLVVYELEKKSKQGKGKDKEAAALALIFVKRWEKAGLLKPIISEERLADDAIFELAWKNKNNCFVATHDKELMKKLKKAKIALIGVRQKKFVEKV